MQLINIFKFFQFNFTFEEIPDTSKQNKHMDIITVSIPLSGLFKLYSMELSLFKVRIKHVRV